MTLIQEYLKSVISYDEETGEFSWLETGKGRRGSVGTVSWNGYRQVTIDGQKYQAHRLAYLYLSGDWPIGDVDHINGDRLDNRASNLRAASRAENMQNQHVVQARSKSGVRGVCWHKAARQWAARIGRKHLGLFATVEDAAKARRLAEASVFIKPVSEFA